MSQPTGGPVARAEDPNPAGTITAGRLPVVAVLGRPNVGKSTLVNRIVGGRPAVVESEPGVTRDRRNFDADWAGHDFVLVDTGGWEINPEDGIAQAIREQAEAALAVADAVIFVVDATAGVSDDDAAVVDLLRQAMVPIHLAANKADNEVVESLATELWSLGLGEPNPVSAIHGRGVGDLLDRVVEGFRERDEEVVHEIPRIAIIGKPNVGKSTLLNTLTGEQRTIVSEKPGTTRDPIDVEVEIDGNPYTLVDTAGIRRKPQITEDADFYAVLRAREALQTADVALLLVDAADGVTHQDARIASEVVEEGVGLVVVLNKWDIVDDDARYELERNLDRLGFVDWAPLIRISAQTGARMQRIGPAVETVLESRKRRVPTGQLNRLVRTWVSAHPPPVRKGRRPNIRYAVQAGINPPTVILFVTGGSLGADYLRFIESRLRGQADFTGTPVRVIARVRPPRRPV
ncbi:MAG: ribosome biogenesis GTPase Der [Acidimicrobiia bacterium]|nr:ribosome biogenesis GTPase Der [Acidimicrobiia bacterium]